MFMKPNRETRTRTLGDIINEKMTEKKTEIQSQFSDGTELIKVTKNLLSILRPIKRTALSTVPQDINPDVSQMYTEVGVLLTRYRSGKVPKAFKMLPQVCRLTSVIILAENTLVNGHPV